mgnify:CR=1 FL=1
MAKKKYNKRQHNKKKVNKPKEFNFEESLQELLRNRPSTNKRDNSNRKRKR